jgi:alpha-beta hydrolase superfamily lysophospholipase
MWVMRSAARLSAVAAVCAGLAACGSASGSSGSAGAGSSGGTVAAVSKNVSFVVDGTTTYGTLDIPAHRNGQRLAAALIIAGSGPTDRNGNQPGVTPGNLRLIANVLASQGIMSLRFDKYFSGQTGAGALASDPGSATVNTFLRQDDAAYAFLRSQPETDASKMLVVGHSEGGMYAMLVAESVSPSPAGLALIEPQDDRILSLLDIQLDEQLNAAVAQGSMTAATAKQYAGQISGAISEFRAGQQVSQAGLSPLVVQALAAELFTPANVAYMRADEAVYPPTLAAKVPGGTRVLVTDGTADTNIPPSTIGPLVQGLKNAGTTGPGLVMIQGIDHDLFLSPSTTGSALDPGVVSAITAWAQPYAIK